MRLTADKKGRLGSVALFPPGRSFEADKDPVSGKVVLVELVPKEANPPQVRLVRRDGFTYLQSDRTITAEDVARGMGRSKAES